MNDKIDEKNIGADTPIPVINEELQVDTRVVDAANIRIIKKVEEETVDVPLVSRMHGYSVEHLEINKYVEAAPPPVRYEGETMVISVMEEEVLVVKRLKLVKEIRLSPLHEEFTKNKRVTLMKERIIIEKRPGNEEGKN